MSGQTTSITAYDGATVDVEHLGDTEDGRRLGVEHPDGREWVVVIGLQDVGIDVEIEVTRRDGVPADLESPEWLVDELSRLARVA